MEERVARLVVDVVEVLRELRATREDLAAMAAADAAGDSRVLAVVVLGLVVGVGHLVQGWLGRRRGPHRGDGGGEALSEVVTIGRTEEAAVAPAVPGEGDLERVEVVREGGNVGGEGAEGRGGLVGGRARGDRAWWDCLLVSRL